MLGCQEGVRDVGHGDAWVDGHVPYHLRESISGRREPRSAAIVGISSGNDQAEEEGQEERRGGGGEEEGELDRNGI